MFKLARSRQAASAFQAVKVGLHSFSTAPGPPLRLTRRPIQNAPALQQRRNLSIHEYRSAKLLESYGIGVPKGDVAHSAAEAEQVAKGIRMLIPNTTNKPVLITRSWR